MTTAETTTTTTTMTIAYKFIIAALLVVALPATAAPPPAAAPTLAAAPSPGPDCFSSVLKLSDCLTFVEEGSNLTKPEAPCCPELVELLNTQPICLCELLGNATQFGVSVDTKRALKLPPLCKVKAPSVSLCAAAGVPVAGFAPGPSANPSQSSEGNGSPSNLLASIQGLVIGLSLALFTCLP